MNLNEFVRSKDGFLINQYRNQFVYTGKDSFKQIGLILSQNNLKKPLLICNQGIYQKFLKNMISTLSIDVSVFHSSSHKPVYKEMEHAAELLNRHGCDSILSVGDENIIHQGKIVKYFSPPDRSANLLKQSVKDSPLMHIAVPVTAGSGSEATGSAVCFQDEKEYPISHPALLPQLVILDPELLQISSDLQKKSSLMDALCHGIEAMWSKHSNEESMDYAKKSISLILDNFDAYLQNDKKAAEKIQFAAYLAGKAIDITGTTAPHGIAKYLQTDYHMEHGFAVALCLPSVWEYMLENIQHCDDPRGQHYVWQVFGDLVQLFGAQTSEEAISKFYSMYYRLNLKPFLGEELLKSAPLQNNPIELDAAAAEQIYENVLENQYACTRYNALRSHQTATLKALEWFDGVCKKNGLSYVLMGGSVIGAVRHKGFVPWDDDIDIGIRIDDLDKFKKLSKSTLPPGFVWSSPETYEFHPRLFGKIMHEGQCCLDIFPIVKTSGNNIKSRIQHASFRMWYKVYLRKIHYGKRPKNLKTVKGKIRWIIAKFISLFFSRDGIVKRADKLMRRYERKPAKRYISICARYGWRKELLKKEWVEGPKPYLPFENIKVPVLNHYSDYLKHVYNNYMDLPPLKERGTDHELRIPANRIRGVIPSYMDELHQIVYGMLNEFIAICKKYNLRYYAISGTALGAVRHQGFIPWDDDVDFGMPRKDYEKFLQVAKEHLSPHLFLQSYKTEEGCPRLFTKIRNSNTTFIEVNAKRDTRNRGLFVDVFPLDGYPSGKFSGFLCQCKRHIFDYSLRYLYNKFRLRRVIFKPSGIRKTAVRIAGFFMTHTVFRGMNIRELLTAAEKAFTKYDYDQCEYICSYGGVYRKKEVIPKKWLGEGIPMEFESIKLNIPTEYDEYLKHFYGDYHKYPPEEKRSVGHPRKIVDLHKSYRYYQFPFELEKTLNDINEKN